MNGQPPSLPVFSPRAGFFFLCAYILSLALCLMVPRALSFLPSVISLGGVLYLWAQNRSLPPFSKHFLYFMLAFGGLAILSAAWAPDPSYSFCKSWKIAAILISGVFPLMAARAVTSDTLHKHGIITALALTCSLAAIIISFEYSSNFLLTRIVTRVPDDIIQWPASIKMGFLMNRSSVFLVLLCLPTLLMLRTCDMPKHRKNALSALMAFTVGLVLLTTQSQTAQIAAVVALPMFFYPARKRLARRAMLYSVLCAMLVAPLLAVPAQRYLIATGANDAQQGFLIDASIPHRVEVWKFVSEQIFKSPLYGHGVESTRSLRAGYIMKHMRSDSVIHPHNAVLQIWVEFGMIGIALAMAFVMWLILRLDTLPAALQRYHSMFFIVMLGVLSMGYGLWQVWLIGMIQTLVALALMAARMTGADIPKNKTGDL